MLSRNYTQSHRRKKEIAVLSGSTQKAGNCEGRRERMRERNRERKKEVGESLEVCVHARACVGGRESKTGEVW